MREKTILFFLLHLAIPRLVTICMTYVIKQNPVKVREKYVNLSVDPRSLYLITSIAATSWGGRVEEAELL